MSVTPIDFTNELLEVGDQREFVDKSNSMMGKIQKLSGELIADNEALRSENEALRSENKAMLGQGLVNALSPQLNLSPDHGTFIRQNNYTDNISGLSLNNAELSHESISDIVDSNNGCEITQPIEAGRHHYYSSTYGGTQSADDDIALEFISAMHKGDANTNAQFMPGFAIAEYAMGEAGAGTNYDDCYSWCQTNRMTNRSSAHGAVSFSYYFQAVDADAWVFGEASASNKKTYVDNVEILTTGNTDGKWLKLRQGQIYHIAGSIDLTDSQFIYSALARTHVKLGTKFRIALPWVASGAFQMKPHTRPVRSHGTVGQSALFTRSQEAFNSYISNRLNDSISNSQNDATTKADIAEENAAIDAISRDTILREAILTAASNNADLAIDTAIARSMIAAASTNATQNENTFNDALTIVVEDAMVSITGELLASQNAQPNLLPNDGSLIDYQGVHVNKRTDFPFSNEDVAQIFSGYNGTSSDIVEVGRHSFDSSTQGGSGGEDNTTALRFLAAMGVADARYLPEFAIGQYTMGDGTSGSNNDGDRFRMFSSSLLGIRYAVEGRCSFGLWVESDQDWTYFSRSSERVKTYINGFETGVNENVQIAANTPTHIAQSYDSFNTVQYYSAGFMPLLKAGAKLNMCCLRVASGAFQILPSKGLVKGFGTMKGS